MANTITQQEPANTIVAAYRPIIYQFTVDLAAVVPGYGATSANPVSFCDVYINGIFYRTMPKTHPVSTAPTTETYELDIQDPIQEYLDKYLAEKGSGTIATAEPLSAQVFCRFRRTYIDADGFQKSDGTAPIQGTGTTDPVAGTGLQSNTIHAVNSTLQHEDNQSLAAHLNAFKTGTWNALVYPLTHRPSRTSINRPGSDYFPILVNDPAIEPTCIKIFYRKRNEGTFASSTFCQAAICIAPVVSSFILPDATKDVAYSHIITISPGTTPLTITGQTKPAWMTAILSGNTITLSGTPTIGDIATGVTVSFTIYNACGNITITDTIDVTETPVCDPVVFAATLPDGEVGVTYYFSAPITGDAPFSLSSIVKPSWMTVAVSGSSVIFSGTPDVDGTGITVSFTISNCSGANTDDFTDTIDIAEAISTYNFLAINNSGTANLTSIDPGFYFVDNGTFPIVPFGTMVEGSHGDYAGIITVNVSAACTIKLYKNSILIETIVAAGSGAYDTTAVPFVFADQIKITIE